MISLLLPHPRILMLNITMGMGIMNIKIMNLPKLARMLAIVVAITTITINKTQHHHLLTGHHALLQDTQHRILIFIKIEAIVILFSNRGGNDKNTCWLILCYLIKQYCIIKIQLIIWVVLTNVKKMMWFEGVRIRVGVNRALTSDIDDILKSIFKRFKFWYKSIDLVHLQLSPGQLSQGQPTFFP